jgi:electron transfer flavoprotein alpha subunit
MSARNEVEPVETAARAPRPELRDVWVVVENRAVGLSPDDQGAIARARELADQLGCYVRVLAIGAAGGGEEAIRLGADRVAVAAVPAGGDPSQVVQQACEHLFREAQPEFVLLAASPLADALAPVLAACLDAGLAGPATALSLDELERTLTVRQPAYAGLFALPFTFRAGYPQIVVLAPEAQGVPYPDDYRSGEVQTLPSEAPIRAAVREVDSADYTPPEQPLQQARVIVAVGRGLRDEEGLELARRLAGLLGAGLAGDRTARELGWVDDNHTIGLTGVAVTPALYVALGIRGDAEHFYGMSASQLVVALHADPQAPLVGRAHAAWVGDVKEGLRALVDALDAEP